MKILAFTGMPCSGKTAAINLLRNYFPVVSMGDAVRAKIKEENITSDLRTYSRSLREKDKAFVAKLCIPEINKIKEKECIVDGIRNFEEVTEFKKKFDVFLTAVHTSPARRFQRYRERARKDDILSLEGFMKRDMEELSWGLGEVIALSDCIIVNEGSIKELEDKIKEIFLGNRKLI